MYLDIGGSQIWVPDQNGLQSPSTDPAQNTQNAINYEQNQFTQNRAYLQTAMQSLGIPAAQQQSVLAQWDAAPTHDAAMQLGTPYIQKYAASKGYEADPTSWAMEKPGFAEEQKGVGFLPGALEFAALAAGMGALATPGLFAGAGAGAGTATGGATGGLAAGTGGTLGAGTAAGLAAETGLPEEVVITAAKSGLDLGALSALGAGAGAGTALSGLGQSSGFADPGIPETIINGTTLPSAQIGANTLAGVGGAAAAGSALANGFTGTEADASNAFTNQSPAPNTPPDMSGFNTAATGTLANTLASSGVSAGIADGVMDAVNGVGSILPGVSNIVPALLSGAGSVVAADAAKSAAQTQADAANHATDIQLQMFNTLNDQNAPYRQAGVNALNTLTSRLNPNDLLHTFNASDLTTNLAPNYQFMLQQGLGATRNAANAQQGLLSGNTLKGINDYAQNYASNGYQQAFQNFNTNQTNIFNRLSAIAGTGQTANQNSTQAATGLAPGISNTITGAGNATAAGQVGVANAINSGLGNLASWYLSPKVLP